MNQPNAFGVDPTQSPRPRGGNNGLIIAVVAIVVAIPVILVCGGILVALLLPAVQAGREAARRQQCTNNMKQIGLALLNYETVYGSLPPAYTVDERGQPLHSWRTLILPFLEQDALYQQIDLTKPWDDPVNQPFNSLEIGTYICPSTMLQPGMTTYVAVISPNGVFSGSGATRLRDVSDGLSNTLLVVETDDAQAVSWMSPSDITRSKYPSPPSQSSHVGGGNALMADGSVHFISETVDPTAIDGLISKDGGEVLGLP